MLQYPLKVFDHFFTRQFLHYIMVVLVGGALDFGLFLFLYYKIGLHYGLAAGYAFFVAASLGFLALRYFVFSTGQKWSSLSFQYAKHGLIALNTLLITEFFLWVGIGLLSGPGWLVKLLTYGFTIGLNFTLSKFFTFKEIV